MKYYIPLVLSFLMIGSITLGATESIPHSDPWVKNMTVAQFKGACINMKAKLSYENKQWVCTGKSKDAGLTSMPLKTPK